MGQWRTQEKISGGFKVMAGLVEGPGAEPPGRRRIFENLQRKFLKKIAKMQYFGLFCKNISKPCVKFSRVKTKNTIGWGNFEKILKIFDENSI